MTGTVHQQLGTRPTAAKNGCLQTEAGAVSEEKACACTKGLRSCLLCRLQNTGRALEIIGLIKLGYIQRKSILLPGRIQAVSAFVSRYMEADLIPVAKVFQFLIQ